MRRHDREITDFAALAAIARGNRTGVLSLVDGDRPYGVTVNYAPLIAGEHISLVFHGARAGRKIDCLRRNPAACFCINDVAREAIVAEKMTTRYRSLVLEGTVRRVDEPAEKRELLAVFLRHLGIAAPLPPDPVLERTGVFVLDAVTVSGKENPAEA